MLTVSNLITRVFAFFQELLNIHGDSNIWLYTDRFFIDGGSNNYIMSDLQRIPNSLALQYFPISDVPSTWFNHVDESFIVKVPST